MSIMGSNEDSFTASQFHTVLRCCFFISIVGLPDAVLGAL